MFGRDRVCVRTEGDRIAIFLSELGEGEDLAQDNVDDRRDTEADEPRKLVDTSGGERDVASTGADEPGEIWDDACEI